MTLDDMKAELAAEAKWDSEHQVLAEFKHSYEFVIYRIPSILSDWKYAVKYAFQRVYRGYDDRYIFSHYSQNAEMVLDALKWMRNHRMGSPYIDDAETLASPEFADVDIHKRWDEALDKMIAGFQALIDSDDVFIETDGKYDHEATKQATDKLQAIWEEGSALYIKHYRGLWD